MRNNQIHESLKHLENKIDTLHSLYSNVEDALNTLSEKIIERDEWILKKGNNPPRDLEPILIYDPGQEASMQVNEGFYTEGRWHFIREDLKPINITHWRYMPEGPRRKRK